jgi:hypothetical protein
MIKRHASARLRHIVEIVFCYDTHFALPPVRYHTILLGQLSESLLLEATSPQPARNPPTLPGGGAMLTL